MIRTKKIAASTIAVALTLCAAFSAAVIPTYADTAAGTQSGSEVTEPSQTGQETGQEQEQNGWVEQDGSKYYYHDGKALTGVQKIEGKFYAFGSDGAQILIPGIKTVDGATVYVASGGTLKTGWVTVGNKAYYMSKVNAKAVKNKKVKYLKIPKSGYLGKAYVLGIKQLNKNGWSLKKAYNYSAKLKYANRYMRKKTSEDYAVVGFTTGKGNCYVMAATFYVQAKLLGYDVHQVAGRVDLPHSWTEIRQGGKTYVYDPNFTNETRRNGYKIRYGQHGTWRYHIQKRMN